MRFAILGAGALGTILGAHLSRTGHDVTMIARGDRARAVRRDGLVVSGLSSIEARPPVIDDPVNIRDTDTLIVATKAIDTAQTLARVAHVRLKNALSLQNGVIKDEMLVRAFGPSRVLGAMADFSGELLASGEVKFTRNAGLYVGDATGNATGSAGSRAEEIAQLVDAAGVRCEATPDIRAREWSKFAGWIPMFVLAVLTRQITWKFLTDPQTAVVAVRIVRETAALAAALKIELVDMSPLPVPSIANAGEDRAIEIVSGVGKTFFEKSPEHRVSAQQDVLRGSRLEYAETVGYALEKSREVGVPMPTLDSCYRILSVAHP
jgi:2-dehydropantoate 2-reductase